jgi:hypothetical protein
MRMWIVLVLLFIAAVIACIVLPNYLTVTDYGTELYKGTIQFTVVVVFGGIVSLLIKQSDIIRVNMREKKE